MLKIINLPSMETRRIFNDLVSLYKIIRKIFYSTLANNYFQDLYLHMA